MKIGIIATSAWPIPYKHHSGDIFYIGLAKTLDEMGHEVTLFAPEGSYVPPHGKLVSIPCFWGKSSPTSIECEKKCFIDNINILMEQDIISDFSVNKSIAENLYKNGYKNITSTLLSGIWEHPNPQHNIIVCSENMRQRAINGATDYEGTPWPDTVPKQQASIKNTKVIHLGIDTNFYKPSYFKDNFYLWLGRWAPQRGYHVAIELARQTGIELVMAGEHPDRDYEKYQKGCCLEAIKMAKGLPNVHFEWLPADPHHHDAKIKLMQKAKAFLFPVQFQEPFGLMQIEALACGTPVIGANYGSVPEIIENGVTGYVVNTNIKDYSYALDNIKNIIPAICREQAVRRFDYSVMTSNYLREWQLVINSESW